MRSVSLRVEHFDLRCRVQRGQRDVPGVERRLNTVAADLLRTSWEKHAAGLDEAGAGYVFIDHVKVGLGLDLSADDATLAEAWSRALHEGVVRTIRRGGPGVLMFPDRATFLAAFLLARLQGATDQACFREFDGLRGLPLGQVCVRLLTEDPDVGRDVLLTLARRGELERVDAALSDAEAEAILSRCLLPAGPEIALPDRLEEWSTALRTLLTSPDLRLGPSPPRNALRAYLLLLSQHPVLGPNAHLARFLFDLMGIREDLLGLGAVSQAFAQIELGKLGPWAATPRTRRFLQRLVDELTGAKAAALLRDLARSEEPSARRSVSSLGGVFFLAPTLAELRLPEFLAANPWPESAAEAGLPLWLVLAGCLGPDKTKESQRDEGLALLSGLPTPPSPVAITSCCARLAQEDHHTFSGRLHDHLASRLGRPGVLLTLPQIAAEAQEQVFGTASLAAEPEWARIFSVASAAVVRSFAVRLGAFGDSSVAYLRRNVFEARSRFEVFADRIEVSVDTCPLQVVLRMAGFDEPTGTLSWLAGRRIHYRFP